MFAYTKDLRTVLAAVLVRFMAWAGITIAQTYVDLLFLTEYPASDLPAFFVSQTVAVLLFSFLITPLVSKGSAYVNCLIFVFSALAVLGACLPDVRGLPLFAFAFCVWLSVLSAVLGVVPLSAISDAFDMRRFKEIFMWVNGAGNVGGMLAGLAVPLILIRLESDALLYVLALLLLVVAFLLLFLRPIPVFRKRKKEAVGSSVEPRAKGDDL